MMTPVSNVMRGSDGRSRKARRWLLAAFAVVVLAVVIAVSVILANGNNNNRGDGGLRQQPSGEGVLVHELRLILSGALNAGGMEDEELTAAWDDRITYASKALLWLSRNSGLGDYTRSQVLQRYALVCFYYATNGVVTTYSQEPEPWKDDTNWLTDAHECQWAGVQCSSSLQVTGLLLRDNGLSGAIPMEMMLLGESLVMMDLTTNSLYMSGADWDVFAKMPRLVTLLLDDNYLSTTKGLPTALGECTDLQKLRLSYNLLEGNISGQLLLRWTKMTHLELEANFLVGNIPDAMGHLDNLVYLYMRRNSLQLNLNFLKTGRLVNLFALWMDHNEITGTIPTEIGWLASLASLSLTNGTLIGTIPSELGLLTGLRRLWLYGNALTGTVPTELSALSMLEVLELQGNQLSGPIPSAVCETVKLSTYTHKSLTADCSSVACTGCCTHCG